MAEEIKTPMSDFDKVEQVKDSAEFILLQDGVNARVEAPIFEQKILDKTNGKYLLKSEKGAPNGVASLDENKKVPNENLTFGEVKEGDNNVVSGGEVYSNFNGITLSGNLINYNNFKGVLYVKSTSSGKVVEQPAVNNISVKISNVKENTYYFPQGMQSTINKKINEIFVFADKDNNYISGIKGVDWSGGAILSPSNCAIIYILIANEVNIGVNPTENKYSHTTMLSEGEQLRQFSEYGVKLINKDLLSSKYSNMYVELIPSNTIYDGKIIRDDVALIYQRLYGNIYSKSILKYEKLLYTDTTTEPSGFVGGEVVRLAGIDKVSLNLETMDFTKLDTLAIGLESEFVLSQSEWIGGYHGNENFSKVYFIIDGEVYNKNGDVKFNKTFVPCNSFSYVMASTLVSNSDKSTLALRAKRNDFINGGYSVTTRLQWKKAVNISMYSGISCISKYFKELVTNDAILLTPKGDNGYLVDNDYIARGVMYNSDDIICDAKNNITQNNLDDNSFLKIWDRVSDTKFYRFTNTFKTEIDKVFESNTTIKFLAKK